jgi:hypothetical protein
MRVLVRAVMGALALLLVALPGVALAVPANDMRANATAITIDSFVSGTNEDATINPAGEALTSNQGDVGCNGEGQAAAGGAQLTKTVWWKFTGNGQPITVSTKLSDFDTVIAVWTESGGFLDFHGCNDDGGDDTLGSELVVDTDPGVQYFIQVGGCDGCTFEDGSPTDDAGQVSLLLASPPANDQRSGARTAPLGASVDDLTFGALSDAGETVSCKVGATTQAYDKTVWYRFTTPGPGTVTASASGFPLVASVYAGTSRLGCGFGPGSSASVKLHLAAGTYLVQIGGRGTGTGAQDGRAALRVDFAPDPEPDRDGDKVIDRLDSCPDQNASARDANGDGCLDPDPDPDHDGVFGAADRCPTQNAAGRDANRDGCLDPAVIPVISARATLRARPTSKGIQVRFLRVTAPHGARVVVRCGRRCSFAKTAIFSEAPAATAARLVSFKRLVGRSFKAGTRIKIYVSKLGRIGKYFEYRVKKGNFKKIESCLNPSSRRVRKCP